MDLLNWPIFQNTKWRVDKQECDIYDCTDDTFQVETEAVPRDNLVIGCVHIKTEICGDIDVETHVNIMVGNIGNYNEVEIARFAECHVSLVDINSVLPLCRNTVEM